MTKERLAELLTELFTEEVLELELEADSDDGRGHVTARINIKQADGTAKTVCSSSCSLSFSSRSYSASWE